MKKHIHNPKKKKNLHMPHILSCHLGIMYKIASMCIFFFCCQYGNFFLYFSILNRLHSHILHHDHSCPSPSSFQLPLRAQRTVEAERVYEPESMDNTKETRPWIGEHKNSRRLRQHEQDLNVVCTKWESKS